MTSDDSNNNWSGPDPTDSAPGPDAGTAPDASPARPADSGGEAAGERAAGERAASEPARAHEGQDADGGYRAAEESAARAQERQGADQAWARDRQAAGGGYRAGDDPARASQGWQPGHPSAGYQPRADQQHAQYAGQQHAGHPNAPHQGGYYPPPPPHGSAYSQHPNHEHQTYGGGPSNPYPYRQPGYEYARPPQSPPARSNSKSIAALILGIGSIVIPFIGFFLGVVGIIVSAISLKEIRVRGEQGSGMAVAGLVCSIVGTVLYFVIILLIIIFAFAATDNNYDYNNFSNIIMEA
ncbi:DUF4190 domain-containing protein [Cohnella hashimotonis]|uniref:DUF4190 domain-containing protein n=1 Tax=Cohnella hashimotonis TaxID=2826895 RepID=A0ABT6TPW7_9BACL|nr:DUF4190 domain-containing protein [Cohnella hashimotonis]MDI4648892.1 DUF4190 domain-containing protein [Cohnella hashimotonis]